MKKLKTLYNKYFRKILIDLGLMREPRWVHLDIGLNGEKCSYLADGHRNREWFCRVVEMFSQPSVLEIGVGGMHELRMLKEKNTLRDCRYHVIDISKQAVHEGKKLFPDVVFKDGSIDQIPFPDDQFDIVYCRHVIEHLPFGYEKAIREMIRVSKGIVIVNIFRWTTGEDQMDRVKKYSNTYNIHNLIGFCRSLSCSFDYFILLKNKVPGVNKYENSERIRTKDHLIMILQKHNQHEQKINSAKTVFGDAVIEQPYDIDPPAYRPTRVEKIR